MNRRLISMVEFVLQKNDEYINSVGQLPLGFHTVVIETIKNYANFLSQSLSEPYQVNGVLAHQLNRFVPCDLEGNVLEKPDFWDNNGRPYNPYLRQSYCDRVISEHQQALDRVMFKGFYYSQENGKAYHKIGALWSDKHYRVEELIPYELTLTETYAKQLGINR